VSRPANSPRKLATLLRRLRAARDSVRFEVAPEPTPEGEDPVVHVLVYSLLMCDAGAVPARQALLSIRNALADYNELRVCTPEEIEEIIGPSYPLARDRALRLRSVLNDIFRRCHALTLAHLAQMPKREARVYLESLEGMPRYASARILLLCVQGHAIPCDQRLRDKLANERIIEPDFSVEATAGWLDHHIRADDAVESHHLLQAWCDAPVRLATKSRPTRGSAPTRAKSDGAKAGAHRTGG
jgi:hypothetical protein